MLNLELEDLLPYYPPQDSEGIQEKLAENKLFGELKAKDRYNRVYEKGPFFEHQVLFERVMNIYDTCLLMGEAGIGKTFCYIGLTESLKRLRGHIKKSFIVTGLIQIEDFKYQAMFGKATYGRYITTKIMKGRKGYTKASGFKRAISKLLKKTYNSRTYPSLSSLISSICRGKTAREANIAIEFYFSGTLYFFDEIQMLKIAPGTGYDMLKVDKKTGEKKRVITAKVKKYENVWRMVHVAKRIKVVLSTATPIMNKNEEMIYIINLLSPLTRQIKTDIMVEIVLNCGLADKVKWVSPSEVPNWDPSKVRGDPVDYYERMLDKFLRGRVIYIARANTDVVLDYKNIDTSGMEEGTPLYEYMKSFSEQVNDTKSKIRDRVKKLRMTGIQLRTYNGVDVDMSNLSDSTENFYDIPLSICCFVFPKSVYGGANYGVSGFTNWVAFDKKTKEFYIDEKVEAMHERKKTLSYMLTNKLGELSAKADFIVNGVRNLGGKWYVFVPYIVGSGGAMIGLALEYSVKRDEYSNPVELTDEERRKDKFIRFRLSHAPFAPGSVISKGFTKRNRYAIVSKAYSEDDEENRVIFELYNHPDNSEGEYLRVVIVSRIGQVGLNLKGVDHIVSFRCPWGPSDLVQSTMRAIRADSHIAQIEEMKNMGLSPPFTVYCHYLACVSTGGSSIDAGSYDLVEMKGKEFAPLLRAVKRLSVTKWILSKRNNLLEYEKGSPECDYSTCVVSTVKEDEVHFNTYTTAYDLSTRESVVLETVPRLVSYFSAKSLASVVEISAEMSEVDIVTIYFSLLRIIEKKILITNANGILCTLKEYGSHFYTDSSMNREQGSTNYLDSYYSSVITGVVNKSMQESVIDSRLQQAPGIIDEILSKSDVVSIGELLFGYDKMTRAVVAELFIERMMRDEYKESRSAELYYSYLIGSDSSPGQMMVVNEPRSRIMQLAAIETKGRGAAYGRKAYYDPLVTKSIREASAGERSVFIHSIYTSVETKSSSGTSVRATNVSGRLRIFVMSQGYWRDCLSYESSAYRHYFQEALNNVELNLLKETKIYCKFLNDEKPRLVDKRFEDILSSEDRKYVRHGFVMNKSEDFNTVEAMWASGYRADYGDFVFEDEDTMRYKLRKLVNKGKKINRGKKDAAYINSIRKSEDEEPTWSTLHYIEREPGKRDEQMLPLEKLKFMYYELSLESDEYIRTSRDKLTERFVDYLIIRGWFVDPHKDALNQYRKIIQKIRDKEEQRGVMTSPLESTNVQAEKMLISRM